MPEMSMDVNLASAMSESDESRQSNPTSLDKPHDASATERLACRSLGLTRGWSGDSDRGTPYTRACGCIKVFAREEKKIHQADGRVGLNGSTRKFEHYPRTLPTAMLSRVAAPPAKVQPSPGLFSPRLRGLVSYFPSTLPLAKECSPTWSHGSPTISFSRAG